MALELMPGANVALPDRTLGVVLPGPFDLSAVILGAAGKVAGDADFVFFNQPSAPGVVLQPGRLTVTPARLRAGAARIVVLASPEQYGQSFGALSSNGGPAPAARLLDGAGAVFARLSTPRLRTETAAQLAEVYRRDGRWRLRAIGQGYADGLAGLARDFGVEVAEEPVIGEMAAGEMAAGPAAEVVAVTNAERRRHGLAPFTVDTRLGAAAQLHTADMLRRGFFDHQNPDGEQVWDRARTVGYPYRKVAENIAAGQRSAAEVVAGWMDSPGHRRNILDAELHQIGVGHATGGSYGVLWTQVFGTPR
jgi:stress response protein SCP2